MVLEDLVDASTQLAQRAGYVVVFDRQGDRRNSRMGGQEQHAFALGGHMHRASLAVKDNHRRRSMTTLVADLVAALARLQAVRDVARDAGQAFTLGGGKRNAAASAVEAELSVQAGGIAYHGVEQMVCVEMAQDLVVILAAIEAAVEARRANDVALVRGPHQATAESTLRVGVKALEVQAHQVGREQPFRIEIRHLARRIDPEEAGGIARHELMEFAQQRRHDRLAAEAEAAELANLRENGRTLHGSTPPGVRHAALHGGGARDTSRAP